MPAARASRARVSVDVTDGRGRPQRGDRLGAWLATAAPAGAHGRVVIALVSDAEMRRLNRTYRGKNAPTDVLSFPEPAGTLNKPAERGTRNAKRGTRNANQNAERGTRNANQNAKRGTRNAKRPLGNIAIARGVAARQARQYGHSLATEVKILALHGLLHLLGYDHDTDQGEMARAESRLRRRAGLPDGLIARAATGRHRA